MISEAMTSIKAQLYDRVSSPLFGSFALSWILWNYKFLIITFADDSLWSRLGDLSNLYPSPLDYALHFIIYPAISAALYIFIYPYPAFHAYKMWGEYENKMQGEKERRSKNQLLTREQSFKILTKIAQLESEYEKMIADRDEKIEALTDTVSELQNNLNNYKSTTKPEESEESESREKETERFITEPNDWIGNLNDTDKEIVTKILKELYESHPKLRDLTEFSSSIANSTGKRINTAKIDLWIKKMQRDKILINSSQFRLDLKGLEIAEKLF